MNDLKITKSNKKAKNGDVIVNLNGEQFFISPDDLKINNSTLKEHLENINNQFSNLREKNKRYDEYNKINSSRINKLTTRINDLEIEVERLKDIFVNAMIGIGGLDDEK